MATPLPVTQIFAFRAPFVNGAEFVLPIQIVAPDGGRMWAGLKGDLSVMRAIAHDLLAVTVADSPRKPALVEPMIEAAEAGRPLFKTGGRL